MPQFSQQAKPLRVRVLYASQDILWVLPALRIILQDFPSKNDVSGRHVPSTQARGDGVEARSFQRRDEVQARPSRTGWQEALNHVTTEGKHPA